MPVQKTLTLTHSLAHAPFLLQMLTAGRWSPTRPGVLVIGRSDGVLDVWDLIDTTTRPTLTAQFFSSAVASLEFRSSAAATAAGAGGGKQLLAVGDCKGSVHLLDFPLSLRRGVPNEETLVSAYLAREASRAIYVQVRVLAMSVMSAMRMCVCVCVLEVCLYINFVFVILQHRGTFHDAEKQQKDSEAAREQSAREAHASKLEAELTAAVQALSESDPVAARTFNADALEARKRAKALEAAAEKYEAIEASWMKELGVKPEEIEPMVTNAGAAGGSGAGSDLTMIDGSSDQQQHPGSTVALQERVMNSPSRSSVGSPTPTSVAALGGASPAGVTKRTELRPPGPAVSGGVAKSKLAAPLASKSIAGGGSTLRSTPVATVVTKR